MIKVFHFANKPAFPLRDGGCVAISSILKSLLNVDEVEVFHFTLSTYKHPFDIKAYPISWLQNMRISSAYVNTRLNLASAVFHLIKNKSYNISRFHTQEVEDKIKEILENESFDIAVFESIYLLPYLELFKNKGIKVIVRTHNVEHQIWSSLAEEEEHFIKRWYLKKLSKQLYKFELTTCKKVDGIVSISEEDALFFQQFEPQVRTTSIPPILNTDVVPTDYDLTDFYYLGAMDWNPNIKGINWFLNSVIPKGLKGTTFHLAGKNLDKKQFQHPNIINHGEVDNALDFIRAHGICVIPLKAGSGVKIKLLENMAMGKPIITTQEGIRGVGVFHEKEVLVSDDPNEFRELMYRLHLDKELRQKLGQNARTYIENNFSEEKLTRRLLAFIKDI